MHGGKRGGKAGVLHADLDGQRAHLVAAEAKDLADAIAQSVAAEVVQHDDNDDEPAHGHDLGSVGGNDSHDDEANGDDGDEGQDLRAGLGELLEEVVDHEAENDRHEYDLHDGHEHAHVAHVDGLAAEQQHQCRRDDRGEDGGACRHAHGQGHVALGQVGHDVGARAAGAGAHEDDAHGKRGVEVEDLHEQECQKRHDDEL